MKGIRIDPLDELVSEYKRKNANGYCERCGTYHGWKELQASHFFGRGKKSVRWDEDNIAALCFGCHQYLGSQPDYHVIWFEQYLGAEKLDLLRGRMRITWPKPDKKALTIYYKNKILELNYEE